MCYSAEVWTDYHRYVDQFNADPSNLQAMQDIMDDKQHPFYEHRLAA